MEVDFLEDGDVYVYLREESDEDLSTALDALVRDGRNNGLSDDGCTRLAAILKQYKSVFGSGWELPPQPTPANEGTNRTRKSIYLCQGKAVCAGPATVSGQICRHTPIHGFFVDRPTAE